MSQVFDRAVSGIALVALAPVFGAVALAVKVDSSGPVFFRQERVGLDGKPFRIHKFRTMVNKKPRINVSAAGDPRVTRVGRFLRKSKLDELPQLIDVVSGKMAIVGPRPEVPEYVEQWPTELRPVILSVRPGITDPASITYRNEAEELAGADDPEQYYVDILLPRKVELYADYVRNRTFIGDLKLIGQTVIAVIRG
ncbi:MAG: sugar transferase [Actinomycetaceae bacterium]|nr:sugar transferase [Actinomycetaceae bacterium]